jgi:hypothetical protein
MEVSPSSSPSLAPPPLAPLVNAACEIKQGRSSRACFHFKLVAMKLA